MNDSYTCSVKFIAALYGAAFFLVQLITLLPDALLISYYKLQHNKTYG
jgi:hypothetical protein